MKLRVTTPLTSILFICIYVSINLSIYLSICLSICLSVCLAIYLSIYLKRSNLKTHVMSKKHRLNKGKLEKFGKREEDIVQALQKYDQEHHPKGETLSTPTRVFRMKVVQAFLKSGTPLNIGVRAGGARGAAAPPQILDNSNFLGRREKIWAKPVSVFFKSLF